MVPAEVNLQGYEFMPLYGHQLFGSDFNATNDDAAWRAGVTLWWKAWNQVPAASLPADDEALCKLAELGRDLRAFKKVKEIALRGFVLCADGRLYHQKLSAWALDAWERRVKDRQRKEDYRKRKALEAAGKEKPPSPSFDDPVPVASAGQDADGDAPVRSEAREKRQRSDSDSDSDSELIKATPNPSCAGVLPRRRKPPEPAPTAAIWAAYSTAYFARYGVEPVRNARVNGQVAQFLQRVGAEEGPPVAAFYVSLNRGLYVSARHAVDLLLRDAESLRTDWATGRGVTDTEARQSDRSAATANVFGQLIDEARRAHG